MRLLLIGVLVFSIQCSLSAAENGGVIRINGRKAAQSDSGSAKAKRVYASRDVIYLDIRDDGRKLLSKIEDVVMMQDIKTVKDGKVVSQQIFRKKNKMKAIMRIDGNLMAYIFDGQDNWMILNESMAVKAPQNMMSPVASWFDREDKEPVVAGTEKVNGVTCWKITMKDVPEDNTICTWVDMDTYDTVKLQLKGMDGKIVTVLNSDFRPFVEKWKFPYHMEIFWDNALQQKVDVRSVAVNQNISDGIFDVSKYEKQDFAFPAGGSPSMQGEGDAGAAGAGGFTGSDPAEAGAEVSQDDMKKAMEFLKERMPAQE